MSEDLYRVILKGYSADKGEYYIEVDFAKLFKISPEKARELFGSLPATIKENLPLEKANQYKSAILKTGALCEVESMQFNVGGLSLE
ncbi:MAG: hypothetical protein OQL09_06135 [Gammaproteobacteria bacterium]|nr:hypothetical protein [Gammaproteobacteria bacterium]